MIAQLAIILGAVLGFGVCCLLAARVGVLRVTLGRPAYRKPPAGGAS